MVERYFKIKQNTAKYIIPLLIIGIFGSLINNDFVLFASYVAFYIYVAVKHRNIFIKYLLLIVQFFWNVLSVFAIENFNIPVANMAVMSSHTGALKLLIWANVIYWISIIVFETSIPQKMVKVAKNKFFGKNTFWIMYVFVVVFICFLLVDIHGSNYYVSGAKDRYSFVLNSNNLSLRLYGWFIYLIPIASIYSILKKKKWPIVLVSILYFLYLLFIGEKFGGFLLELYMIGVSYILPDHIINKTKFDIKKMIVIIGVAMTFLLFFALLHYYIKHGSMGDAFYELFNRVFNGQGDVWWGVYDYCQKTGLHPEEIKDELGAIKITTDDQYYYNFGIYKLMKIISPDSIVRNYAAQHVRFAMSTDASFYYYFGSFGVLVWRIVSSFVVVKITNGLIKSCVNSLPFSAFLYSWLLVAYLSIAIQSNFAIILTRTNIFSVIVLLILYIYHYKNNDEKIIINNV